MIRSVVAALVLLMTVSVTPVRAQETVTFKNFVAFKKLVPGVDFYAANRQLVTPYLKPAAETIVRLKELLGENLPQGAIFICSNLKQKDSIYEPKVLRAGYGWTLTATTPEVRIEEIQARIKSQMGGDVPAEFLSRMKNRMPDMVANAEQQMVSTVAQQVAHAVIQTMLAKDLKYRSSRVDDMGKSPLPDWLDIGIASYASGNNSGLEFLQQNMDQTFPIEDVLSMSRPFTASSIGSAGGSGEPGGMMRMGDGGNGGPTFRGGFPPGGGFPADGGFPPGGGFPGGRRMGGNNNGNGQNGPQRMFPKDEQDRMLFDGQASTFFSFMIEKVGIEKVKQLITEAQEGKESRDFVSLPDVLGSDFNKTEKEWTDWVKALKAPQQGRGRGRGTPQERSGL